MPEPVSSSSAGNASLESSSLRRQSEAVVGSLSLHDESAYEKEGKRYATSHKAAAHGTQLAPS
jgi:hypothetical protein